MRAVATAAAGAVVGPPRAVVQERLAQLRAQHEHEARTAQQPQAQRAETPGRLKILVLHGPNLNLLGRREPHIYGTTTLEQIDDRLRALAAELDVDVETFQSNHEGELLDKLQAHTDDVQGCVLNPAALTQYGVGLHDCIKAMPFPVIEVHLSNIHAREEWRRRSIIGEAAKATVQGFGWRSYTAAFRALVEQLREG